MNVIPIMIFWISTQKGGLDITAWFTWFLDCLKRSMKQTDKTIAKTIARAQFWETKKKLFLMFGNKKYYNRYLMISLETSMFLNMLLFLSF